MTTNEELLEKINDCYAPYEEDEEISTLTECEENALAIVQQFREECSPKWIAVSEQGPPKGKFIIVCDADDVDRRVSLVYVAQGGYENTYDDESFRRVVTHYQPLPSHINEEGKQ